MRTRIAGGLFVSHLRSETDLKSQNQKNGPRTIFFLIVVKIRLLQQINLKKDLTVSHPFQEFS